MNYKLWIMGYELEMRYNSLNLNSLQPKTQNLKPKTPTTYNLKP